MAKQSEPKQEDSIWKTLGLFGIILSELIAWCAIGIGGGYTLHLKLGLSPLWTIATGALGLAIGFLRVYLLSKRYL